LSVGIHFEREWPWVRQELLRVLRGRQVPAADAEDIVQEVAARALATPKTFATREDLARWCWRVGWRLRIDAVRKAQRVSGDECPEVVAAEDTARLVEGRLELEAALSGMTTLSSTDRLALFAVAPADASRQDSVRLAVRRHRARARLLRAMGGVAGVLGVLDALRRRLQPHRRLVVALPAVLIVALELGSLFLLPATRPASPSRDVAETSATVSAPSVSRSRLAAPSPAPRLAAATVRPTGRRRSGAGPTTLAAVPLGEAATIRVSTEERVDPPTACVHNVLGIRELCVDRPGPALPVPDLGP
jgi:DNA-directed RNA polymerase specialized sigma24 family protein